MKMQGALMLWTVIAALGAGEVSAADVWPPVSKEELAMSDDPSNPGAAAIILYREVNSDDVKSIETQYVRIKVLTDEGRKYADIEIPYLGKAAEIADIRARTVRPDGTPLDFQGQIFDRIAVKARKIKVQVKAFTLPEVQKGSILEYSYTIRYRGKPPDFLKHPSSYEFSKSVAIPSVTWTLREQLFTRRARFTVRQFAGVPFYWVVQNVPQGAQPRNLTPETIVLEMENVPAFQEEEFMPPEREVKGWVGFYYMLGPESVASYWRGLGSAVAQRLARYLGDPKRLKPVVAEISPDGDEPERRLRKLYARVQQIRYLSYEPDKTEQQVKREGFKENKNVEDVLRHGYAYADEINLVLVALARSAGFESAPVRVKSRDTGFFMSEFLNANQLDASIVWVRAAGKDYFLDPASRYCPFGMLPWEETATRGIVLVEGPNPITTNQTNGSFDVMVTVPNVSSAAAVVQRSAQLHLSPEGQADGTVTVKFIGEEARERRVIGLNADETFRNKRLEEEVKKWLPAAATVELKGAFNWDQTEQPLAADFSVRIPDYAASTGRRLIFRAALFENQANAFKSARRAQDVYFAHAFQEVDEVVWTPPAGYRVANTPEKKQAPRIFGNYSMAVESSGGALHSVRRFTVEPLLIPVSYYAALRSYFNEVRVGDDSQIVLENAGVQDENKTK